MVFYTLLAGGPPADIVKLPCFDASELALGVIPSADRRIDRRAGGGARRSCSNVSSEAVTTL